MSRSTILKKLGLETLSPDSFQILLASLRTIAQYGEGMSLESLRDSNALLSLIFSKLDTDDIKFMQSELPNKGISIDESQIEVQKLIPQNERKRFAAYYTVSEGTGLLVLLVQEYLRNTGREKIVIADPFLGSGRTLTTVIQAIGPQRVEKVWGIEPLCLPALVAYAALLHATGGMKGIIDVRQGDAFQEIPGAETEST